VFRDAADFCVIRLWDRDHFFGHPRFSYLPDPNFTGIVLTFDLAYENLQRIDSPKFATIDWPHLNCRTTAGALIQMPLFANATQVASDYLAATDTFTLMMPASSRSTRTTSLPPASSNRGQVGWLLGVSPRGSARVTRHPELGRLRCPFSSGVHSTRVGQIRSKSAHERRALRPLPGFAIARRTPIVRRPNAARPRHEHTQNPPIQSTLPGNFLQ